MRLRAVRSRGELARFIIQKSLLHLSTDELYGKRQALERGLEVELALWRWQPSAWTEVLHVQISAYEAEITRRTEPPLRGTVEAVEEEARRAAKRWLREGHPIVDLAWYLSDGLADASDGFLEERYCRTCTTD